VIKIVEVTLVTQNAWPELHKGTHYKRQVLLDAVNALRVNIGNDDDGKWSNLKAVRDRISKDEKFVRTIGRWVCDLFLLRNSENIFVQVTDRLSHHRGQMRHAASDQIALFQLGIGDDSDECAQRVHALLENDVYVYPGQWANDKDGRVIFF